ncbi:DUF2235 domain containing protein [Sulfitobacter noctilucicola]|uniref:Uncharacterized protein (DUF2235 family) n=1 Tax=Sulfitobacter noctilucicola TaxID=1342301 RepID=A0A7W6Q521_9RHOB|nr:DUF2235 domain-containing protein [Sulfitobacter noctilucicola]KIN63908.1 DUF2235 domain containing protein [Sulfitobacter noctilucicola]MBB4175268.1 uncharacterized protein (DUF2235 family) [Sulfitobacter noctilucicola]
MRIASQQNNAKAGRAPATHVIIMDGTLSTLAPAGQTNAGRTYTILRRMGAALSIYYEPGLQWDNWRSVRDVATGKGINRQIRRAYGWLASRYRPGDRIYLFGYSRGAYAVRSLAGVIDLVGLLHADHATHRNIRAAYRHYERNPRGDTARAFSAHHCHAQTEIEMIGVWDTVKSLGINAPVLWRLSEHLHAFHNHDLSAIVKHGFHALAHDENRVAFAPVMWECHDDFPGRLEQVWFPGAHGDVGGQLGGFEAARPLANIPLVWMLGRAMESGLPLPDDWETGLETDPLAPARGTWRGHGRFLMTRKRRVVGADISERFHESVLLRQARPTQLTSSEQALFVDHQGDEPS